VVVDDRNINFDYLIINSGSTYLVTLSFRSIVMFDTKRYQPPFKESRLIGSARGNTLRESYTSIRKAKRISFFGLLINLLFTNIIPFDYIYILVIGGGLVGVELAAEIVSHFPGKEVVLVHSQSTLVSRFPKKAVRYVDQFLRARGVTVVCGERVVGHKAQVRSYITDSHLFLPLLSLLLPSSPFFSLLPSPFSLLPSPFSLSSNIFLLTTVIRYLLLIRTER
jgi:NADPH-dependent 2,4-dienoyl-CoA reductase/sulfur reductase-like enzyme